MKKIAHIVLILVVVASCKPKETGKPLFSLLPASETKVDFVNRLEETEQFNIIEYLYFNNGAGVAAGDINNDGLVDLYFTSNQQPNALYINKGNLRFENITEAAGVAGEGDWKTGVTMADVNGDGYLDIYVCQVGKYKGLEGRNQLFINQGNLTFKEEAKEYGLDFQGFSTQAAFFDYDLDGDLDMYLLNHSVHTARSYGNTNLRFDRDPLAGDRLYRNDEVEGRRIFRDVTAEAGIYSSQIGYGLGVNVADISNDGYPDIYISNDFHENDYLYINNGNGTFTEQLTSSMGHTSRSSMGNDVGDINNDGLLDVIVLDMLPDEEKIRKQSGGEDDYELAEIKRSYGYYYQFVRNTLQLNLGGGMFSEIGLLAGVYSTDWSWSPLFCDVDNDGWKDLFITSGIYRRANDLEYVRFLTGGNRFFPKQDNKGVTDKTLYEKMPLYPNVNYMFRNNGDLTFSNKVREWGFEDRSYSNGSTYADLDNDGDLDLVVNNINGPVFIYKNNASVQLKNHYLSVKLKGNGLNIRGTGVRVTVYCGGQQQVAEQFATRGFMSSTSDVLHFGLGMATTIDSLVMRWPGNAEQRIKNIPADQIITLERDQAMVPANKEIQVAGKKLFTSVNITGLEYRHQEDPYSDFKREKLIPHSLSAEGPALAVGDVNGDGRDDLLVGGAKGQATRIYIQKPDGSFRPLTMPVLEQEAYAEDVDAAFFDADGDGDEDLYLVRGGNEIPTGNPLLSDRMLINDGKGGFTPCEPGALPDLKHNGSCVRPADFDSDGDIDLFVGSRSLPGAYGWTPFQFLLENDGQGHFKDVTGERAEGLRIAGMVTDAVWTDYDRDGDPDLVVTGEWMRITVFRNDKKHFTEVTAAAGLEETSGWWNCIEAADVDGDGDIDLIGGNLGLNSILKASPAEPVEMYLSDFDNNGSLDQVICSYQQGTSYPVASFDELKSQIGGLDKKFPSYTAFAGRTTADIFGKSALEQSVLKKAVLFESCLFVNNGDGTFTKKTLPTNAQFSPVRGILAQYVDHDGNSDLLVVGNNYAVRPSYGRYDASYGWFLKADTSHTYKALMPAQSGFIVKGDARKIRRITINAKPYVVVAVNNGELQIFELGY
jgi:enediyne biosynthesis protein E4